MKFNWSAIRSGGLIIVLIAVPLAGMEYIESRNEEKQAHRIGEILLESADKLNAGLPKMIDNDTRLDSAKAGPGKKMTYSYTYPEYAAGDFDVAQTRDFLLKKTRHSYCTDPDNRFLLEEGVTLDFVYFLNDGKEVINFEIPAYSCTEADNSSK